MDERADPGDVVVFEVPYTQAPFEYYAETSFDERGYQHAHRLAPGQGVLAGSRDLPDGIDEVWVIRSHTEGDAFPGFEHDPAFQRADYWLDFRGLVIERWVPAEQAG